MSDPKRFDHINFQTRTPEQVYLREIAIFLTCGYALKQVSLPTQTDAYASGDVLFAAVEVPEVAVHNGDTVLLDAVKLIDDDEIKQAIDLIFFKSEVGIGDVNAAATVPSGAEYLATVKLVATDYTDLGDISVAEKKNVNEILATADDSKSIWVAGIVRGAATYTTESGLSLMLSIKRT